MVRFRAIGGRGTVGMRQRRAIAGILFILSAMLGPAVAESRRVLLLHSFGQHFQPWSAVAARFREQLVRKSDNSVDVYEASLESARLSEPFDERPIVDYLRALFDRNKLELAIAIGAPAARFFQRHRNELFPSTPLLITAADQSTLKEDALTAKDATVPSLLELPKLLDNIFHVLPDTRNIFFVIGASPLERFWVEAMRKAFQPFASRATFEWLNDLSLDEMVKRAAILPPHSAIFYASIRVDAGGIPNEEDRALTLLRETANAPIFSYLDSNLGHGVVGGPVISTQELGRKAAEVAVRILRGEPAGSFRMPPVTLGVPTFDWRELQRWNISEARLPLGSIVQFREITVWERYRWQIAGVLLALLAQSAIIGWLLVERYGRQTAQKESKHRLSQVIHLNRSAEVGALSASFAHEVRQPLAAIMMNLDFAERLLLLPTTAKDGLRSALADTREAAQHAIDVIGHMGMLLKPGSDTHQEEFNLAEVITDAIDMLGHEATKRGIILQADGLMEPLLVRGDRIHLQQVILNLANNGMDAMTDAASTDRIMTIHACVQDGSLVEVSVSDSGPGIPNNKLAAVFDTFYTTKKQGTGLGLSIARTIVEEYGGKIWAENRLSGGAIFRFTLPLATVSASLTNVRTSARA
jgi:signal transduction histidine kinase